MTYTHSCPNFHVIIEGPLEIEFKFCWKCGRKMFKEINRAFQKQSSNEVPIREGARSGKRIRREDKQETNEENA